MTPVLIICILSVFAYFTKGVTGAASAIVFNAGLLTALALGLTGGLSLRDGLYWIAIADVFASALMALLFWRKLKLERFTLLLLAGMVPVTVTFALLLPRLELRWLSLVLALAVLGAGMYLALRPDHPPASLRSVNRWALPTGALAGVLSGLFGMGGPVVFILLSRASDDPGVFRNRTVIITNAAGIARLATLAAGGVYTTTHLAWFGYALPVIVGAMLLGIRTHRRLKPRPFRIVLGGLVTLAGIGGLLRFALLD
ncbi:MAG: sulfite exporter TauE/SafE family protein [Planctomycetota bacterium]|nr:sulfite exporter TauE/SafE family protein [Planctomycetota bacterium]